MYKGEKIKGVKGGGGKVGITLHAPDEYDNSIKAKVTNKHGLPLDDVTLTNVAYMPSGAYNLFSGSKMLKDGWKLVGDEHSIRINKNLCNFRRWNSDFQRFFSTSQ